MIADLFIGPFDGHRLDHLAEKHPGGMFCYAEFKQVIQVVIYLLHDPEDQFGPAISPFRGLQEGQKNWFSRHSKESEPVFPCNCFDFT